MGTGRGKGWKNRGGICEFQEVAPESKLTSTGTETEKSDVEIKSQKERHTPNKVRKKILNKKTLAENGQTFLDVSKGDIRITKNGAAGGGLDEDETSLNEKGYWITGTTTTNNVVVEKEVTTKITLCDVNITCDKTKMDCINVSHAEVVITLIGKNELLCKSGNTKDGFFTNEGAAITKDGMDGELVIQCEKAGQSGHKCDDSCGRLIAKGQEDSYHAGAIGNSLRNTRYDDGFCNLTIKGGNIEAKGGYHSPGIGGACTTSSKFTESATPGCDQEVRNIRIEGGNITAIGNTACAGIGGGASANVDGIYISGGRVEATGGTYGPGIGSVRITYLKNIVISGGDTLVIAKGDKTSNAPGIGYTNLPTTSLKPTVENVVSSPQNGWQGYIQDGESMDNYTFMEGTPFKSDTAIKVGKFYTVAYFGPFRDENTVEKTTNEQIGANHIISKTGGNGFTKEQLKELTKISAKDKTGQELSADQISFKDEAQISALNEAKKSGKTGEYELTFWTADKTEVTVKVYLRDDGTDAAGLDTDKPIPTIGANNFEKDTGGSRFTEEEIKLLGEVKGKDKDGTTLSLDGFTVDPVQFDKINEAKTSGKPGIFDLTYTSGDGAKVTVKVTLMKYDVTEENPDPDHQETIKGMNIISKTGGKGFSEAQLKELSMVNAFDQNGVEIDGDTIIFPDADQIARINQAKEAGETGNYQLTMKTPNGTEITVQVCLRDEGTDSAEYNPEHMESFLTANDASQETGGAAFTGKELLELCRAEAKDKMKNTVEPSIDEKQKAALDEAKQAGKTGKFLLTFLLEDGTKTAVIVTLTGEHKVKFDPNGGYDTPSNQTVKGGEKVIEPKDPKRDGYLFAGWYFTDESGKEVKWDFSTPVHQNMTLKARWKKPEERTSEGTDTTKSDRTKPAKKTGKKKTDSVKWNYQEIKKGKTGAAPETGEADMIPWVLTCMAGGTVIFVYCFLRKRAGK